MANVEHSARDGESMTPVERVRRAYYAAITREALSILDGKLSGLPSWLKGPSKPVVRVGRWTLERRR